jgi:hypothetical protein
MDKVLISGMTEECSSEIMKMIEKAEWEYIFGLMEELIMENGTKESNMDKDTISHQIKKVQMD